MSEYAVTFGPHFPVFNTAYFSVFSPNIGKYGPEITLYWDTFHTVNIFHILSQFLYYKWIGTSIFSPKREYTTCLAICRTTCKTSRPEVILAKGILKVCSKFTGEHPCRSVILIKLLCNFIEITFRHGCSPVNLLHNSRTPFPKNTSGWLLLYVRLTKLEKFEKIYSKYRDIQTKGTFWQFC